MAADYQSTADPVVRMRFSPSEILRALQVVAAKKVQISMLLPAAETPFVSRLRFVDPQARYIFIEPGESAAANTELLLRPRCSFHATAAGWHIEFVATDPQTVSHANTAAIRLKFPVVFVDVQKRAHIRAEIAPRISLRCVADASGILSFDGEISDISHGGLGFLAYDPGISLDPGTVLKGCRIEPPGGKPVIVDLEVRYTEMASTSGGARVKRSGCQFLDPSEETKQFITDLFDRR